MPTLKRNVLASCMPASSVLKRSYANIVSSRVATSCKAANLRRDTQPTVADHIFNNVTTLFDRMEVSKNTGKIAKLETHVQTLGDEIRMWKNAGQEEYNQKVVLQTEMDDLKESHVQEIETLRRTTFNTFGGGWVRRIYVDAELAQKDRIWSLKLQQVQQTVIAQAERGLLNLANQNTALSNEKVAIQQAYEALCRQKSSSEQNEITSQANSISQTPPNKEVEDLKAIIRQKDEANARLGRTLEDTKVERDRTITNISNELNKFRTGLINTDQRKVDIANKEVEDWKKKATAFEKEKNEAERKFAQLQKDGQNYLTGLKQNDGTKDQKIAELERDKQNGIEREADLKKEIADLEIAKNCEIEQAQREYKTNQEKLTMRAVTAEAIQDKSRNKNRDLARKHDHAEQNNANLSKKVRCLGQKNMQLCNAVSTYEQAALVQHAEVQAEILKTNEWAKKAGELKKKADDLEQKQEEEENQHTKTKIQAELDKLAIRAEAESIVKAKDDAEAEVRTLKRQLTEQATAPAVDADAQEDEDMEAEQGEDEDMEAEREEVKAHCEADRAQFNEMQDALDQMADYRDQLQAKHDELQAKYDEIGPIVEEWKCSLDPRDTFRYRGQERDRHYKNLEGHERENLELKNQMYTLRCEIDDVVREKEKAEERMQDEKDKADRRIEQAKQRTAHPNGFMATPLSSRATIGKAGKQPQRPRNAALDRIRSVVNGNDLADSLAKFARLREEEDEE